MKAQPTAQMALLDLQALDTRASQLAHRRASIPELAELAELAGRSRALSDTQVAVATQVSDLTRAQTRAEADVEVVRTRIARDQALLDSGSLGSARALTDLQRELESLARRVSDLEDAELEVMERLETASARHEQLEAQARELADHRARCEAAVAAATHDIDLEAARVSTERERVLAELPTDLVELYTRIARSSPTAAAALRHGRCGSCQIQLPPAELGRIRAAAPDEVCRCEECRAILVRTPESGL